MEKETLSKHTTTFPMPAAVISVGTGDKANIITLAYLGKVNMKPPTIAISIQPKRHSYHLIEEHREFVINYPSKKHLKAVDYIGTRSGRNVNKWEELNLTKQEASVVKVPMIKEFPWNMECKVVKRIELGSHVCYMGEVVAVHSDPDYLKGKSLDADQFDTFAYLSGEYIELRKGSIGKHGFSMK
jgi:flavin reductase (DIM6/NTAB) family NADH-FMN oxidoreductase RutF